MKAITILRSQEEKVINVSDRALFFENLSIDSGIESYHFDSFLEMEENKTEFVYSQLPSIQIKNLMGDFIPILEKKPERKGKTKKYTVNTQFNVAIPYIYEEHLSKALIPKKTKINIAGVKFNQNANPPFRNIKSHLMKQSLHSRMHIGNYGLYAWGAEYMQKVIMPLSYMDITVYFESDTDALNKIEYLRKHIELANEYYNDGLHFLSRFIRSRILPVQHQEPLPVKLSKKNDLLKLLDTVYNGKITNYNTRMVVLFDIASGGLWDIYSHAKTKGLSKITILLNRKREEQKKIQLVRDAQIIKIRKMRDYYMKLRIALDLFGKLNLDELNIRENKIINLTLKKNKELMNYSLSNKCKHIKLVKQLMIPKYFKEREKNAFGELKKIIEKPDAKAHGLMQCSVCNLNVLCPHHFDMFESLSNNSELSDIIDSLVKKYSDANSLIENAYFCKICGEKLVQQIDEGNVEFVNNERVNTLEEVDKISSVVWREVRVIVMGHIEFTSLMDKKSLISTITNNIHPLVYNETEKMKNIKTMVGEQISYFTNLSATIYGYAQAIKLLAHHPQDMKFKYKIRGSSEKYAKCPDELVASIDKISGKYSNKELFRSLMCEGLSKVHPPQVTVDDIKHRLPYEENAKTLKPQYHIGQRKLLLSEVQFLTKYKMRYCIYAGSAPGHKTHLLSSMFPQIKFILVDPNKFELKINHRGRQTTHRKIRHEDIVHIYHDYPTRSNTWGRNKKISQMNPAEIKNMVSFIKSSRHKIFIIEDYYTSQISEIFSGLSRTSFISDIRSNVGNAEFPSDFDIIWNTSMMYNWIYTLRPDVSMIKFRLPYFEEPESVDKYMDSFSDDFEMSKKFGIDFLRDYRQGKFAFLPGKLYLQAWPGQSSAELRLHIKKEDLDNKQYYNFKEIEQKLYYYNSISRGYYFHENKNALEQLGFCHCNDCALENNIWEEYISKFRSIKSVGDYIRFTDKATNRSLIKVHNVRVFDHLNTREKLEECLRLIAIHSNVKKRNFGKQKGNLGKEGGSVKPKTIAKPSINLKYLQTLFSIALSKILSQKEDLIQKITSISRDSIKPMLVKAFKAIQSPIQTIKFSNSLNAEYVIYSGIYRYLYRAHKKFDKKLRVEDVKRVLGVELLQVPKLSNIVSSAIIPEQWEHVDSKGAIFKNDLYTKYAYKSFLHFMNYVRDELYMVPVFNNASHMEHVRKFQELKKMEEKIMQFQYAYFKSQIFLHYYTHFRKYYYEDISLNTIFCRDGRKHNFNIYVYGNTEVTPSTTKKFILDPQMNRKFLGMKRTDSKCSICGELYSKLKASNSDIKEALNSRDSINSFYNLYIFKCPVKNIHSWKSNECVQCKITKQQLFSKDENYYNKYKDKFELYISSLKTEIPKIIHKHPEEKKYVEFNRDKSQVNMHHIAKLCNIPISVINNIGLIEGHYFHQVESGEFNPLEHAKEAEHQKRTLVLSMYIRIFLIEYEMLKTGNIASPSLEKFVSSEEIDSTNFPTLREGYTSKYRYYSSRLPAIKLNDFIMESLFNHLMFILKNHKGNGDGAKKFIKYILGKIIKAERNLSITNIITEIEDEEQGDSQEIADTETIDVEGDFYDPFNTDTFDLDLENHEDNMGTVDD